MHREALDDVFPGLNARWPRPRSYHWLIVVLLVACALGLGRGSLAPASLWRDDAWVTLVHRASVGDALRMGLTSPGFSMVLREWLAVVGFSELRAQVPALVAFAVTPALLYLLAIRMRLRWPSALLAAGLLATSVPFVNVAGRVKVYSFDGLAAVVVMWLTWNVVEEPRSRRHWVFLGGGSILLTVVTSAVAAVIVGALVVAGLAAWRAKELLRPHVFATLGGYGAFAVLWWVLVISRTSTPSLRIFFSQTMIPGHPGQSLGAGIYARLADLVGYFTRLASSRVVVAVVFLAVAAVIGSARRLQLVLLLVAPLLVSLILAVMGIAPLGGGSVVAVNGSRIDIHLYPSLALLFAVGFEAVLGLGAKSSLLHLTATAALALIIVGGLVISAPPAAYPREETKSLVAEVERDARPGDLVVVQAEARYQFGLYTHWPVQIVFSPRFETGFTVATPKADVYIMGGGLTEDGNSDSAVFGLVERPSPPPLTSDRVFLLTSTFYASPEAVDSWLRSAGYHQVAGRRAPGAALELWDRRSP